MRFLRANAPTVELRRLRAWAHIHFGLQGEATPLSSERDQNTLFREPDGSTWTVKVANIAEDPSVVDCQLEALQHVQRVDPSLPVPRVRLTETRQKTVRVEHGGAHILYALSFIEGHVAAGRQLSPATLQRLGSMHARLGRALRGFFHKGAGGRDLLWDLRMAPHYLQHANSLIDASRRPSVIETIARFTDDVLPRLEALRAQVIHGDLHGHNLLLSSTGEIRGIIDFGDMIHGPLIVDLAATLCDFMTSEERIHGVLENILSGYVAVTPLEREELSLLFDLIEMRSTITLIVNEFRRIHTPGDPNQATAAGSGFFAETLRKLGREAFDAIVSRACSQRVANSRTPTSSSEAIIARRKQFMGSRPYLFYDPPLHLVRGEGVWLIDASGRRYLDCYNNVPIVGHCHPRVVDATAVQNATLNTNTRYLGEQILEYAERLGGKTGGLLTACAFVNSGSEANDIAWRMATAWTKARGAITQEFAYHGITEAIEAVSPSASRTAARAAHVRTIVAPDVYRGQYRAGTPDVGPRYADDVDRAIESLAASGLAPAAYFVESAFMSNGILEPQPEYLSEVFRRVRAAGGLCIADEVQSGFGRMGTHFWGYQHHGVVPDIITIGKPAGNGYPIGVVVTRLEILDHFMEQTAFFSTFGGNNVSCAAGLAVLDVIDEDGLVERAAATGAYFKQRLNSLMTNHAVIGDVRATGLAFGVELVSDRQNRTPAPTETARLVNRLRDEGVLVGSEGVHANIIKMRPPLVFRKEHVDEAVAAFERALAAL